METSALTSRVLTTAAEWDLAARLKRDYDYAELVDGVGNWTQPEIHALHQERWGEGEVEFQMGRLREEANGGELRGWFRRHELVGFATIRETNLLAGDGPRLLIVRQIYVLRADAARMIASDLAAIADARGIEESDLSIPAEHAAAFEAAGFAPKLVTARRRGRS